MNNPKFVQQMQQLKRLGAATVHEALGQRGYVDSAIAPLDPASRIAGRAYTVDSKGGDNLMMHYAISQAQPGDIVVVDYKGYMRAAAVGDLMAYSSLKRGLGGMVIDGAVRDAAPIVEMGFPMFARGLCITGPTKSQPGKVNVPIVVGGCTVEPGDIVVGDRDGLVVIPSAELDEVIGLAQAREEREADVRTRIDAGATTVEILELADALRKQGLDAPAFRGTR
jgi:4-hydroxy-4-methyl-2-oxoglutarate aldolase